MFCNFHSDLFPSINNCIAELGNISMDKCTYILLYIFVHECLHSLCILQNHHTDMYSSAIVCWHTFWSCKNCEPVEPSCFSYHSHSAKWKESMKWRAKTESCFGLQVLISWMISILLSGGQGLVSFDWHIFGNCSYSKWPALAWCEKLLPYLLIGSVCLSSMATCENTTDSCSHTSSTH